MSERSTNPGPDESARLADSPWLWFGLFAAMALVGLVAVAPRYGLRQAKLEQRYDARVWGQAQHQGRASGEGEVAARASDAPRDVDWYRPGVRASLVPLMVLIAGVVLATFSTLWWRQRGASPWGSP